MEEYSKQHKKAWEYNAYDFWVTHAGTPAERAKEDMAAPEKMLRKYARYFDRYEGIRIANICGSCGKKAIPLALLGADVTVFDISEQNRQYAMETAQAAGVRIGFEVCDILEIDLEKYGGYFDIVFMEGGILHYFHNIDEFMAMMHSLLKPGGKMICSDFHHGYYYAKNQDEINKTVRGLNEHVAGVSNTIADLRNAELKKGADVPIISTIVIVISSGEDPEEELVMQLL